MRGELAGTTAGWILRLLEGAVPPPPPGSPTAHEMLAALYRRLGGDDCRWRELGGWIGLYARRLTMPPPPLMDFRPPPPELEVTAPNGLRFGGWYASDPEAQTDGCLMVGRDDVDARLRGDRWRVRIGERSWSVVRRADGTLVPEGPEGAPHDRRRAVFAVAAILAESCGRGVWLEYRRANETDCLRPRPAGLRRHVTFSDPHDFPTVDALAAAEVAPLTTIRGVVALAVRLLLRGGAPVRVPVPPFWPEVRGALPPWMQRPVVPPDDAPPEDGVDPATLADLAARSIRLVSARRRRHFETEDGGRAVSVRPLKSAGTWTHFVERRILDRLANGQMVRLRPGGRDNSDVRRALVVPGAVLIMPWRYCPYARTPASLMPLLAHAGIDDGHFELSPDLDPGPWRALFGDRPSRSCRFGGGMLERLARRLAGEGPDGLVVCEEVPPP